MANFRVSNKPGHCSALVIAESKNVVAVFSELAALKRLLNLGAHQTLPKLNRAFYIPILKENNVRKGFFEINQFLAMRNELPEHLKPLFTIGYKLGWRFQEITSSTTLI
jgi:hypothetical protein